MNWSDYSGTTGRIERNTQGRAGVWKIGEKGVGFGGNFHFPLAGIRNGQMIFVFPVPGFLENRYRRGVRIRSKLERSEIVRGSRQNCSQYV
jgi:hypothetical protein